MEARAIRVVVNGTEYWAERKKFKTGSVGYYFSGKVMIEGVKHQCQLQLVEVGSKPKEPGAADSKQPGAEDVPGQQTIDAYIDKQVQHPTVTPPVAHVDVTGTPIRPSPAQTDTNLSVPPKVAQTKRKATGKGSGKSQADKVVLIDDQDREVVAE